MGNPIENSWREKAIFMAMLFMLAGLFISRATLSVGMGLFFLLTIVHKDWKVQLKNYIHNSYLVLLSVLFFIPLVSGFWSRDMQEWMAVMQIKLPLLFFPIAFAGTWQLSRKQWLMVAYVFLVCIFLGCAWSAMHYFLNSADWNQDYLKAKLMATPLENDHIRFSWLVSAGVLLALLLLQKHVGQWQKAVIVISMATSIIYLHLLAARMGLACLYIILVIYCVWWMWRQKKKWISVGLLAVIVIFPLVSWFAFPTFQNRINYILYDLNNVRSGIYLPGSNDGARVLSLKAGWQIIQNAPMGVGAGDLKEAMQGWYGTNTPSLGMGERFLPCSELLVFGGVAGWAGIIILIIILTIPFFVPTRREVVFWYCLNAIVVFSFVFDMSIEAQFGVFIFSFLPL
ncbi:MAG TPA: O-antigen ligase family protein, partial [Flavisolibacter sp.]|nr:O-antigen ligase family protein [Flavisolibacter sp.]